MNARAAPLGPGPPYVQSDVMISGVLLDLAGVIYEGERALPGALEAVNRLRHAGLSLRFVTNTTRMTKNVVLQRLARLGLGVTESELFTPAQAAREWLARNDCSPSLLVHPDLVQEFQDDSDRAGRAVVVGDAGEAFHYASLRRAFRELIDGAKLIALAKNRSFKDADGKLSLDAGAFVAALEFASQRAALVLGKRLHRHFNGFETASPILRLAKCGSLAAMAMGRYVLQRFWAKVIAAVLYGHAAYAAEFQQYAWPSKAAMAH
jgi:HAD superfamily hydrolase (TIGR01458 family)